MIIVELTQPSKHPKKKSKLQVETQHIESAYLLKPPSNHGKSNWLQAITQNVEPWNVGVHLLQDQKKIDKSKLIVPEVGKIFKN